MTEEPPCGGCGIWRIWWFKGPFHSCCAKHDRLYVLHNRKDGELTLGQVDALFYTCMKRITDPSKLWHKALRILMYNIAHLYGRIFWKGAR